jgi:hypothetical protein
MLVLTTSLTSKIAFSSKLQVSKPAIVPLAAPAAIKLGTCYSVECIA